MHADRIKAAEDVLNLLQTVGAVYGWEWALVNDDGPIAQIFEPDDSFRLVSAEEVLERFFDIAAILTGVPA